MGTLSIGIISGLADRKPLETIACDVAKEGNLGAASLTEVPASEVLTALRRVLEGSDESVRDVALDMMDELIESIAPDEVREVARALSEALGRPVDERVAARLVSINLSLMLQPPGTRPGVAAILGEEGVFVAPAFIGAPEGELGEVLIPLPALFEDLDSASEAVTHVLVAELLDEGYGVPEHLVEIAARRHLEELARARESRHADVVGPGPSERMRELARRGMEFERELRELALELVDAERNGWVDDRLLDRLARVASEAREWLENVSDEVPSVSRLANALARAASELEASARAGLASSWLARFLREVNDLFVKEIGVPILWGEPTRLSSAANTLSAGIHRLCELIAQAGESRAVILSTRPEAEAWARAFLRTLSHVSRSMYTMPGDLEPSHIMVTDREVIARLGSAPQHAAHVDVEKGVLEYYDDDEAVAMTLLRIVREVVPVKSWSYENGVLRIEFEPTPENVERICEVLPLAISMDARIEMLPHLLTHGQVARIKSAVKRILSALTRVTPFNLQLYSETSRTIGEEVKRELKRKSGELGRSGFDHDIYVHAL